MIHRPFIPGLSMGLLFVFFTALPNTTEARNFRVNMVPNNTYNCQLCHVSGSGGPRNVFGQEVEMWVTPNGTQPFWDKIFNSDADGDKITNGEELGDPDGDGNPTPGATLSDPRNYTNIAPQIGGSAPTAGYFGEPYSASFSAFDRNQNSVSFSKVSGPTWVQVTSTGGVSGTPPEGPVQTVNVTIRATDDYTSPLSTDRTFSIDLSASFTGWQNLQFSLPADNTIAGPGEDPDNDDIPNAAEYALRLNPKQADALKLPGLPGFNGSGQMQFALQVRDDDPNLSVQLEASGEVPFQTPAVINPVESDPNSSDGLKTWTFTDTESSATISSRFGQFRFQVNP